MLKSTMKIMDDLYDRYPALSVCKDEIQKSVEAMVSCHRNGGKILVCGNGGSASDSEHIVGELMKGFLLPRSLSDNTKTELADMWGDDAKFLGNVLQESVKAISLVSQSALMTAFGNDQGADGAFAQQVYGYGNEGDILIAISTSGNSKNVIYATQIAKYRKMTVVLMSGETGGKLKNLCDINICVPSTETFKIQEYHLPVYHCFCAAVENELFGE